ncbi:MAG: MBL fold metallo-hydrolase [Anaerolineaceae bacterium]|nr:MAG: MBL fold metallo-hydrolase [Anaerolineaceae bacterium]
MKINVTYLDHSGFLIEWDSCYWLFDYYKGQIPDIDDNKMLVIFVSHSHGDHFNPKIFDLYKKHPNTTYLISSDIKINEKTRNKYGITDEIYNKIIVVKSDMEYQIFDIDNNSILMNTLKSTDSGVAFLIRYMGKTIYHAGDLHLWMWMGEDKQFNNDMKARYYKEISKLKDRTIDLAFTPLDPRQEEWYDLGLDALLDSTVIKYVFPMHFWDKPEIISKYKEERKAKQISATIMDIKEQGQCWSLDI